MAKNVTEITSAEFEKLVTNSKDRVILDFYSSECSPCEALAPKFESFAELFGNDIKFYKMFRQENRELATRLGVKSSPTLVFFQEGKEVYERMSGEIRKWQIGEAIKSMVGEEHYNQVVSQKEKTVIEADVVILGGGPAGLTTGIYAGQAKLKTVIVEENLVGGQVKTTHMISNYPGTGGPMSGMELMDKMDWQARGAGAEIIAAVDVTGVEFAEKGQRHTVYLDDDVIIKTWSMVLAMGSEPRAIGVKGEKELKGKGVSYCATCDGKYYEGQEVVVIGGGNSAVEESIFLTKFATKVSIVHQFDHFQANKTAQEEALSHEKINVLWNSEPRAFEKTEDDRMLIRLQDVKTGEESSIVTDGVFIFVGYVPNLSRIPEGSVVTDQWGYIRVTEDMETNLPGVYAVGDIRSKKWRQAATAVADGCIAAIVSEKYIESSKKAGSKASEPELASKK